MVNWEFPKLIYARAQLMAVFGRADKVKSFTGESRAAGCLENICWCIWRRFAQGIRLQTISWSLLLIFVFTPGSKSSNHFIFVMQRNHRKIILLHSLSYQRHNHELAQVQKNTALQLELLISHVLSLSWLFPLRFAAVRVTLERVTLEQTRPGPAVLRRDTPIKIASFLIEDYWNTKCSGRKIIRQSYCSIPNTF